MKRTLLIMIMGVAGPLLSGIEIRADEITDGYLAERETELYRASEQAAAARRALEKARGRIRATGPETEVAPHAPARDGFTGLQDDISALEELRERLQTELSTLRGETIRDVTTPGAIVSVDPVPPDPASGSAAPQPGAAGAWAGLEAEITRKMADWERGLERDREALLSRVESELTRLREAQRPSGDLQSSSVQKLRADLSEELARQFEGEMTDLRALKASVQEELGRVDGAANTGGAEQGVRLQQLERQLTALAGSVPNTQQRQAEMEVYRAALIQDVEALSKQLRKEWKQEAGELSRRLDEQDQALAALNTGWSEALQQVSQVAARERQQAAADQDQSIDQLRREVYAALDDLSVADSPGATAAVGQRLVEIRRSMEEQLRGWKDEMEAKVAGWNVSNREDFAALRDEWRTYRDSLQQELAQWELDQVRLREAVAVGQETASDPEGRPVRTWLKQEPDGLTPSSAALPPEAARLQREKVQLLALKELVREALGTKKQVASDRRGDMETKTASQADRRIHKKLGMTPVEPVKRVPEPAPMGEVDEEPPPAPIELAVAPAKMADPGKTETFPETASLRPAAPSVPRGAEATLQHRGAVDAFLTAAADAARLPETAGSTTPAASGLSPAQVALLRSGWQYSGGWLEGRMNGQGVMTYPDGQVYDGSWQNGIRSGRGTLRHPSGWTYTGDWADGLMHGGGTLSYPDGWTYTGSFSQGALTGQGRLKHPDSWTYAGSWLDGVMQGEGILSYPDGWMYEGTWQHGRRDGNGTLHHPEGWNYTGDWTGDQWNGQGTLRYTDGWTYSGEWNNGRMNGEGTLTSPEGWQYSGQWKEGAMEGDGELRAAHAEPAVVP